MASIHEVTPAAVLRQVEWTVLRRLDGALCARNVCLPLPKSSLM